MLKEFRYFENKERVQIPGGKNQACLGGCQK
jgi:hypothetical protein